MRRGKLPKSPSGYPAHGRWLSQNAGMPERQPDRDHTDSMFALMTLMTQKIGEIENPEATELKTQPAATA